MSMSARFLPGFPPIARRQCVLCFIKTTSDKLAGRVETAKKIKPGGSAARSWVVLACGGPMAATTRSFPLSGIGHPRGTSIINDRKFRASSLPSSPNPTALGPYDHTGPSVAGVRPRGDFSAPASPENAAKDTAGRTRGPFKLASYPGGVQSLREGAGGASKRHALRTAVPRKVDVQHNSKVARHDALLAAANLAVRRFNEVDGLTPSSPGSGAGKLAWRSQGNEFIGRNVERCVYDGPRVVGMARAEVVGWLPKKESDFEDALGRPQPLWLVRYLPGDMLEGEEEELELHELLDSLEDDTAAYSGPYPTESFHDEWHDGGDYDLSWDPGRGLSAGPMGGLRLPAVRGSGSGADGRPRPTLTRRNGVRAPSRSQARKSFGEGQTDSGCMGTTGTRRGKRRCGQCATCKAEDCNVCKFCKDKAKNGGANTLRRPCSERKPCLNPPSEDNYMAVRGRLPWGSGAHRGLQRPLTPRPSPPYRPAPTSPRFRPRTRISTLTRPTPPVFEPLTASSLAWYERVVIWTPCMGRVLSATPESFDPAGGFDSPRGHVRAASRAGAGLALGLGPGTARACRGSVRSMRLRRVAPPAITNLDRRPSSGAAAAAGRPARHQPEAGGGTLLVAWRTLAGFPRYYLASSSLTEWAPAASHVQVQGDLLPARGDEGLWPGKEGGCVREFILPPE